MKMNLPTAVKKFDAIPNKQPATKQSPKKAKFPDAIKNESGDFLGIFSGDFHFFCR